MRNIMTLLAILSFLFLNAQENFYKTYEWDQELDINNFETDPSTDIISFKDKRVIEFYYTEDKKLSEIQLIHKILWLNSDERIEEFNKIYLPYNSNSKLLDSKARVISPSGEITELDKSKVLTATDEEKNKTYKYFALEGITKGSFVEYMYVLNQKPKYNGQKVILQSEFKKNNVEFDLFSPQNLVFDFKSYNDLIEIKQDTTQKKKLHWYLKVDVINNLEEEEESAYIAEKKYFIYKLDKNNYNNTVNISSYTSRAKSFYKYLFVDLDKKAVASIQKVIKNSGIAKVEGDEGKIRTLENYLKNNYYVYEVNSNELLDIVPAVKNKTANEGGLIRIYIATLNMFNIKTEVVLTTDRFKTKFDDSFEAGNFLTDYLLYFPSIDKFTSPIDIDSRVGIPPYELTDNYGLFIKELKVGNFKSGIGKIKFIKPLTDQETSDNMRIEVFFDQNDLTRTEINYRRELKGYYASNFQPYTRLVTPERMDEVYTEFLKSINEGVNLVSKTITNDDPIDFGVKPIIFQAEMLADVFVDKAGTKYLFKMGELISRQIEMYQDNTRILPIESNFHRLYDRVIKVHIPSGYEISNLEDINIQHEFELEGKKVLEFHSYYKLEGNILTIHADEYYKINSIETKDYQDYRKVVNSAADFNKIVLIIERKSS